MENKKKRPSKKMIAAIGAVIIAALMGWLQQTGMVTDPLVIEGLGQTLTAVVDEADIAFDDEWIDAEDTAPTTGAFIVDGAGNVPVVR